jgi:hypothetical protein
MNLENKTPAEICLMALRAREELNARKVGIVREHSDRIKRLDSLVKHVCAQPEGDSLPGFKAVTLTPDLARLIVNPIHGL